ncbi:unnamed protein product [Microthlaspi erraticum]|uniref:Uncharacterized protein n=1 Tax=Microthlaspi erraticum TaxID=1685480 RepID=A0A6D2I4K7_9BRAS|nr:unnamed protein product [Microthlaspi erraticum]
MAEHSYRPGKHPSNDYVPRTTAPREQKVDRTVRLEDHRPASDLNVQPNLSARPNLTTSATINPIVPMADHNPLAGRMSRLTIRTVRSTRSRF